MFQEVSRAMNNLLYYYFAENTSSFECDFNNGKLDWFEFFCFTCTRRIKGFTNRDITFLYNFQDRFWNTLLGKITLIFNAIYM
jgi:hypothetical protein